MQQPTCSFLHSAVFVYRRASANLIRAFRRAAADVLMFLYSAAFEFIIFLIHIKPRSEDKLRLCRAAAVLLFSAFGFVCVSAEQA